MNAQRYKRRRGAGTIVWVVVGLAAMAVLCIVACCAVTMLAPVGGTSSATPVTAGPTSTYKSTPTAQATKTLNERLRDELIAGARVVFGSDLRGAEINTADGLITARVDYDLRVVWDDTDAVRAAIGDLIDLAPEAFGIEEIDILDLRSVTTFEDVYGDEGEEVAFRFVVDRGTAGRINWDNVDPCNMGVILDSEAGSDYAVNPALYDAWIGYQLGP